MNKVNVNKKNKQKLTWKGDALCSIRCNANEKSVLFEYLKLVSRRTIFNKQRPKAKISST